VAHRIQPRPQIRDQPFWDHLWGIPEAQEPHHARRAIYFAPGRTRWIKRHEEVPREEGARDWLELRATSLSCAHQWLKTRETLAHQIALRQPIAVWLHLDEVPMFYSHACALPFLGNYMRQIWRRHKVRRRAPFTALSHMS
jgi:hypothetical protein